MNKLNEGFLARMTKEYAKNLLRSENGIIVDIDGKKRILMYEDFNFLNDLINLDGKNLYKKTNFDSDTNFYVFCALIEKNNYKTYNYYCIKEEDLGDKKIIDYDKLNLYFYSIKFDLSENDFEYVKVAYDLVPEILEDANEVCFYKGSSDNFVVFEFDDNRYAVYDDWDNVVKNAKDKFKEDLEDNYTFDKDYIKVLMKEYGNEWLDTDEIDDWFKDYFKEDADNLKGENNDEYGNEFYSRCIDMGIIENTTEYFYLDYNEPKFDLDDYQEELISKYMKKEGISDSDARKEIEEMDTDDISQLLIKFKIVNDDENSFKLDHDSIKIDLDYVKDKYAEKELNGYDYESLLKMYLVDFGNEELDDDFIDFDKLVELAFSDNRQVANSLSSYDGLEHDVSIDGKDYYVYID